MSVVPAGHTHVWRAKLDHADAEVESLALHLDADECDRASRFHFDRDRRRFIVARAVLRLLIGQYTGAAPGQVAFVYGRHGKPHLACGGELDFSIAHSSDAALFAFTSGAPVGVDIEHVRPIEHEDMAERFFSPSECEALRALAPELRLQAFFACWTRKEAYIKGLGEGLSIPLDRFSVSVDPDAPAALLGDRRCPGAVHEWVLQDVDGGAGFRAALATSRLSATVDVFDAALLIR
jgi:4'-phosphopantetheinyl transferase